MVLAVGQQGHAVLAALAALAGIAGGHGGSVFVEHVGLVAQFGRIADGDAPGRVDHQHGIRGHGDAVAGHGDVAGAGDRHAVDLHVDRGLVALQRIEDGQAIRHRTAVAVDAQGDGIDIERGQLAHQVGGDDAVFVPAVADVAVDVDFSSAGASGSRFALGLDLIPLCRRLYVWHCASFVSDAKDGGLPLPFLSKMAKLDGA